MSNPAETGHVNNIHGFKTFIETVTTFVGYNPSNGLIQIAAMNAQWSGCLGLHNAFESAEQTARNPINFRKKLFEDTHKLLTRSLNYFKSSGADKEIIKDVKGLADRFRGHGLKRVPRLADGSKDPNHVSNSHQGFVQRADTFRQILALYASDVHYVPNEPELQLAFLQTRADALETANNDMPALLAPVNAAMIARDKALYEPVTGLVDVAMTGKAYVVGLYGPSSPEAKLVKAIKFKRRK